MPGNYTVSAADVEKQLDAPMPWIGMYIAAASFLCTLGMAADTFRGFRSNKYWFPNKFFSLNATSLTLLAMAMKLPLDQKMASDEEILESVEEGNFAYDKLKLMIQNIGLWHKLVAPSLLLHVRCPALLREPHVC